MWIEEGDAEEKEKEIRKDPAKLAEARSEVQGRGDAYIGHQSPPHKLPARRHQPVRGWRGYVCMFIYVTLRFYCLDTYFSN